MALREDVEQRILLVGGDSDAVVGHAERHVLLVGRRSDRDRRRAAVDGGVFEQVLKQLTHLFVVGGDRRQRLAFDGDALVFEEQFELVERPVEDRVRVDRLERLPVSLDAGVL